MPGTDTIMPEDEDEDVAVSKKLLTTSAEGSSAAMIVASTDKANASENPGCLIDAKPPESIKHLIAKDDATLSKYVKVAQGR